MNLGQTMRDQRRTAVYDAKDVTIIQRDGKTYVIRDTEVDESAERNPVPGA